MSNPSVDPNITTLVETFPRQIVATVEASTVQRIQAALAGALPTASLAPRRRPA